MRVIREGEDDRVPGGRATAQSHGDVIGIRRESQRATRLVLGLVDRDQLRVQSHRVGRHGGHHGRGDPAGDQPLRLVEPDGDPLMHQVEVVLALRPGAWRRVLADDAGPALLRGERVSEGEREQKGGRGSAEGHGVHLRMCWRSLTIGARGWERHPGGKRYSEDHGSERAEFVRVIWRRHSGGGGA